MDYGMHGYVRSHPMVGRKSLTVQPVVDVNNILLALVNLIAIPSFENH
jgi:hypothetical protein